MTDLIDQIIEVGAQAGHQHERLPRALAHSIVNHEPGFIALLCGTAQWGVDWNGGDTPVDPVGVGWKGSPAGAGKHLTDYVIGGLGIAHYDSGSLIRAYEVWGAPDLPKDVLAWKYDRIRKDKRYWRTWYMWGKALVERPDFLRWSLTYWLEHFWAKAKGPNLAARAANARIRNSNQVLAESVAKLPLDAQLERYVKWMIERDPDNAKRAKRRANYIRRCDAIFDELLIQPFP